MANSCFNDIRFSGSKEELSKVKELFVKLAEVQYCSRIQVAEVFFNQEPQNIYMSVEFREQGDDFIVSYQTRWVPNFQDSLKIAQEIEVSFIYDAFEFGCMIYQRCIYVYGESLHFPKMIQKEFAVYDFDGDSVPYDPKDYQ